MHLVGDLNFDATRKVVPGVSLVICSAIVLANQALRSAAYAALMAAMITLGPICFLRLTRGGDMKMKEGLIGMGCALVSRKRGHHSKKVRCEKKTNFYLFEMHKGAFALLMLLLLIPATKPSPDSQKPPKEPEMFDRILAVTLSVFGQDLVRVIQYAQYGFIFSQVRRALSLLILRHSLMRNLVCCIALRRPSRFSVSTTDKVKCNRLLKNP